MGVVATDTNEFWILDQGLGTLVHVQKGKGKIVEIPRGQVPFPSLVGICYYSGNKLLFSDSQLGRVFLYDPEKKQFSAFCKAGLLDLPTGILWLPETDEVWVTETRQHRIAVLNPRGEVIRFIGKRGTRPGAFNFPTALQVTPDGDIIVIDALNHRLQIFNKEGKPKTVFGEAGDATGYFARSKGVAVDYRGNIYVSDALFHAIQIFSPNGIFLYYFGSQGRGPGEFWMPSGIFIDANDYLYIADTYNARIQIYQIKLKP